VYYTLPGGKTRVALNLENLFNKVYFPTAGGDNNISPGAPRSARLTMITAF
jgi:catecholate siderophore receptor